MHSAYVQCGLVVLATALVGCTSSISGTEQPFTGEELAWTCTDNPSPQPSAAAYSERPPHPVEVYSPKEAALNEPAAGVVPRDFAGHPGITAPDAWTPDDRSTVQLVACADFVGPGEQVRMCTFEDLSTTADRESVSLPLHRATWQIHIIEPRTGKKRATSEPLDGNDQQCPRGVTTLGTTVSGTLYAVPTLEQVADYVRPFVEQ